MNINILYSTFKQGTSVFRHGLCAV